MPSRVIRWFRHLPDERELLIGFQSGREYAYLGVPESVYLAMKRAFSKGKFFNAHIRDHYPCEPRGAPVTAGAVQIGTAGWSIPSRYLNEIPAGSSHLSRYARVLPVTEIDSSFYKPHRLSTYERWAASVGDEFRFCVKLPKALTHEGTLVMGASEMRDRFLAGVAGLGAKLAVLLVQLPPSLVFDRRTVRAFFSQLRASAPVSASIACEPRHASWSTAEVDELLRKLAVSRVAVDPARWDADARPGGDRRLAYFRLHGSPRLYFSNYEPDRLEQLRQALSSAARESDSVWCIFDNTAHGHGLGNALWMQQAFRTASPRAAHTRD